MHMWIRSRTREASAGSDPVCRVRSGYGAHIFLLRSYSSWRMVVVVPASAARLTIGESGIARRDPMDKSTDNWSLTRYVVFIWSYRWSTARVRSSPSFFFELVLFIRSYYVRALMQSRDIQVSMPRPPRHTCINYLEKGASFLENYNIRVKRLSLFLGIRSAWTTCAEMI